MPQPLRPPLALAAALLLFTDAAALAMPLSPSPQIDSATALTRGPGWRGGAYRPPVAVGRPGGYYRPPVYGGWRRPYYGWRPGGAIAAGAAIGVLSAAAAAAYATSAAPAPGLCWYYTDATYTSGFWDDCP